MRIVFLVFALLVLCLRLPYWGLDYEMSRVWIVRLGPFFLWLFSLYQIWGNKIKPANLFRLKRLLPFVVFWLIFLWLSLLNGPDPWKSYWGNFLRGDGYLTFLGLCLFSLWLVSFWQEKWLDSFCWIMVLGGVTQALGEIFACGLLSTLGCSGWMGNSVLVASFLTMVIPFWTRIYLENQGNRRKFLFLIGLIIGTGLLLTDTRTSLVGLFFLIKAFFHLNLKVSALLTILILFTLAFLNKIGLPSVDFVAESRSRIWTKGFISLPPKYIWGWGLANYDYAFESVDWPMRFNYDVVVDKAHNEALEYLVTGGIPSFIFYLTSWFYILKNIWLRKKAKDFLYFIAIVYLFLSSINPIPMGVQIIYWWLIAASAEPLRPSVPTTKFIDTSIV